MVNVIDYDTFVDMGGRCILIDLPIMEAKKRFAHLNMMNENEKCFQEGKWTALYDFSGNEFGVDLLLKLAEKNSVIQIYFSENREEGSLVVINQGKVIREFYDYTERKEENKNIGLLVFEMREEPLEDWRDISIFAYEILEEDETDDLNHYAFDELGGICILIDLPIMEAKQRFMCLEMATKNAQYFKMGKWTVLYNLLGNIGDIFDVDLLLKLAEKNSVIQVYYSEDRTEGSLVVISQGKVIREFYDYSEYKEDNKNIGLLEFEAEEPLENWVDISFSIDKLLNINL